MSPNLLPLLASACTGTFVGVGLVLTKVALAETGPMTIAFLRYLIGIVFLLPFLLRMTRVRFRPQDILPVVLLGIGQFGVLIGLLNYSVTVIEPGRSALIFAVFPLLTMGLAVAAGHEPFTLRRVLGILITIVGVGFSIGTAALGGDFTSAEWLGAAASLGAALIGAICSLLYRPFLQRYPTLQIGTLAMFSATVVLGFMAIPEGFFTHWPDYGQAVWLAIGGTAVVSSVGYLLWLYALRHIWASNVTSFMGLSPLTASLLGVLFLGEVLTLSDAVAVVLVLTGLVLALWRSG